MIQLPIYFHTEETSAAMESSEQLNIPVEIDDTEYEIKPVVFMVINYIMPHPEGRGCMIGSGHEEFRSPLTFDEVIEIVSKGT